MASPVKKTKSKKNNAQVKNFVSENKQLVVFFALAVVAVIGFELNFLLKMESEKPFAVELATHITGQDKPCGAFNAWGVAAVGEDSLVVSDQGGRLIWFDRQGNYKAAVGKKGEGKDDFKDPSSVTADDKGNV